MKRAYQRNIIIIFIGSIAAAIVLFLLSLLATGSRDIGLLTNIDGVPFPRQDNFILMAEKLAHTDIYLREPVLAKNLHLTITFDPKDIEELAVGVRENSFWLSYEKINIYRSATNTPGRQSREVILPLTNALQETDRSIDIMFFAANSASTASEDEGVFDSVGWELQDLKAQTVLAWPTTARLKNYLGSIIHQERAL